MKIALLEPIGVSKEVIDELSAPITEKGHEFVYYDTKTTDPAELAKRSEGCDIVMIANNPYPTEVVEKADALKMLSVAFTGIDHIGTDKCKEKNIMICNAAGYSNQTVAELIIGMAIDALRHVVKADGLVRNGGTSAGLGGKKSAEERSELSDLDRSDSWQQNYSRHLALKLSLTTEVSLRKQKHLESSINH